MAIKLSVASSMSVVQKARAWFSVALLALSAGVVRGDRMAFPIGAEHYESEPKSRYEPDDRTSSGVDASSPPLAAGTRAAPTREFFKDAMAGAPPVSESDAVAEVSQPSPALLEAASTASPTGQEGGAAQPTHQAQAETPPASVAEAEPSAEAALQVARPQRAVWQRHWRQGIVLAMTGCVALGLLRYLCAARPEAKRPTRGRKPWLAAGMRADGAVDVLGAPEYLAFFGLDEQAREADVVRAYREQSRRLHPDRGGDVAEFKAMQRRFEQALAFVRRRGRGDRSESR